MSSCANARPEQSPSAEAQVYVRRQAHTVNPNAKIDLTALQPKSMFGASRARARGYLNA
jgi:hypothetical protein